MPIARKTQRVLEKFYCQVAEGKEIPKLQTLKKSALKLFGLRGEEVFDISKKFAAYFKNPLT